MKIIIAGCGKIGSAILTSLVDEGHDVIVLDNSPSVIKQVSDVYDVMCVGGSCTDRSALEEAGVAETELFVATTGSDELNMLSCFIARRLGAKHVIARIREREYQNKEFDFISQQLDLSMSINPEALAAQEICNMLKLPSAVKIETFSHGAFEMIELRLRQDSKLDGMKLMDMRSKYNTKVLVCAVQRGDDVFIPDGNFVLKAGDKIGLTGGAIEVNKFLHALNVVQKKTKNIMIFGASKTAFYLSKLLLTAGYSVKVVEQDKDTCQDFSEALGFRTMMIQGDGTQHELLMAEGLTSQDAFVALTGFDELNILLSIFSITQNVPKVVAKVNRDELADMAEQLGLDAIISPRRITANILVGYARALENSLGSSMETLYRLMDDKIEALEFSVTKESECTGKELRNLRLKPNILIAGIIRNGNFTITPGGTDMILPKDKVVIIAAGQRINNLSDILK